MRHFKNCNLSENLNQNAIRKIGGKMKMNMSHLLNRNVVLTAASFATLLLTASPSAFAQSANGAGKSPPLSEPAPTIESNASFIGNVIEQAYVDLKGKGGDEELYTADFVLWKKEFDAKTNALLQEFKQNLTGNPEKKEVNYLLKTAKYWLNKFNRIGETTVSSDAFKANERDALRPLVHSEFSNLSHEYQGQIDRLYEGVGLQLNSIQKDVNPKLNQVSLSPASFRAENFKNLKGTIPVEGALACANKVLNNSDWDNDANPARGNYLLSSFELTDGRALRATFYLCRSHFYGVVFVFDRVGKVTQDVSLRRDSGGELLEAFILQEDVLTHLLKRLDINQLSGRARLDFDPAVLNQSCFSKYCVSLQSQTMSTWMSVVRSYFERQYAFEANDGNAKKSATVFTIDAMKVNQADVQKKLLQRIQENAASGLPNAISSMKALEELFLTQVTKVISNFEGEKCGELQNALHQFCRLNESPAKATGLACLTAAQSQVVERALIAAELKKNKLKSYQACVGTEGKVGAK
jgi:hypothetical protein